MCRHVNTSDDMNLIELQENAVAEIVALPEQGRRAASFGHTLLNKPPRSLRRIRTGYEKSAARLGFRAGQIGGQWQDVKDMAVLEAHAA